MSCWQIRCQVEMERILVLLKNDLFKLVKHVDLPSLVPFQKTNDKLSTYWNIRYFNCQDNAFSFPLSLSLLVLFESKFKWKINKKWIEIAQNSALYSWNECHCCCYYCRWLYSKYKKLVIQASNCLLRLFFRRTTWQMGSSRWAEIDSSTLYKKKPISIRKPNKNRPKWWQLTT